MPAYSGAVSAPRVFVLAGPNGAGKSTAAARLIPPDVPFVNADDIAREIRPLDPSSAALAAGRQMLAELDRLTLERTTFAFETTLSGRAYLPRFERWRELGYEVFLTYLWLPDPELAIGRIETRVALGGHDIPPDVVRRRYDAGLRNFFHFYQPLAAVWRVYDVTALAPRIVAEGAKARTHHVLDPIVWQQIRAQGRQP